MTPLESFGRRCKRALRGEPQRAEASFKGWPRAAQRLLVPLFGLVALGCGNAIYAVQVSSASSRLEEARELRAEELAPYEYTMAVEHLHKARSEAAEADYGDAIVFAEVCEEYSEKAIRISQEAHRSAGR